MTTTRIILSDFVFLVVMLLLSALSIFSYQRISDLNQESELVNHTNEVKLKLAEALLLVRDVEYGQRYFLLTNDSSYLQSLKDTHKKKLAVLSQIRLLTQDNTEQQTNLSKVELLVTGRFEQLNDLMARVGKRTPADLSGIDQSKISMEVISSMLLQMIKIEDRLLGKRSSKKNYTANITPLYSMLLSVFAIMIVGIGYVLLRNETRLRFLVQDDIKKLNDYFKDLPAIFAIVKGPAHLHELANDLYTETTGNRELAGKTFRDAFPELAGQGFYELLDNVYSTGELFIGKEMPFTLSRGNGNLKKGYFNFILQPIFRKAHKTEGILIFGYEITEMIEARQKVEETEQQSRLAIEAAHIGTFDWDMEQLNFSSSPRLLEIFGFNGAVEVPHQALINRFHPADKPVRDKAVEDSYTRGSLNYEARIIWPDKTVRWVSVYGKIIHTQRKEALRMYGTVIDVTEQKTVLEVLRESEAKFRLLADSMPQFVWTGDVLGNLDYFSQAVYDYSGLSPTELKEQGWITIVHPDDREENVNRWRQAISTGEEFIFEHRFKNDRGTYRWQLSRALPQKDKDGVIQRWVGTSTDIQDQKMLSEKLEQQISERTQQLIVLNQHLQVKNNIFTQAEENALIGSYSWNLQSGSLEYSDNLFRLFGYEPNEFVPSFEKYHSMVHPEDQEQVMKDGMETMNTKNLVAHTYRVITKNGTIKHFRSTGKIMGEEENTMLIGTVQDITQDTLLNEILRIKNLELERSNSELESFNYIASHDLQEPLRKIQAFSQRIVQKEGGHFSAFSQDYFSRINSAAARMQNLINALLSYSRADASFRDAASVDLNQVISNIAYDLQDMLEDKNAKIEYNSLPVIHAVSIQVYQLFMNLITNSAKYSKSGLPPHIKITAAVVRGVEIMDPAADEKMNYWKIIVADNGIGFEQEYEHKIFELFQRLHTQENYVGTGIGLAICKKIIRNHQGFIKANGNPGVGSTFYIYFPFSS